MFVGVGAEEEEGSSVDWTRRENGKGRVVVVSLNGWKWYPPGDAWSDVEEAKPASLPPAPNAR